jgi:ribonuclease BN (tRNA processing enzyme)
VPEATLSVTVLGADGSYPGPGGACSGYLVTGGGANVWLDAGSGTLANLQRHVRLDDVDAVVLSHSHSDHWTDVEGFYVACRYFMQRRGVPVYAPAGLEKMTRGVASDGTLVWTVIQDGSELAIGPLHWRFSRTDHPVETLGARIELGGRALVYSADTGPSWRLSELGQADVALVEASFLADREGSVQHLSARQAGTAARQSGAGRLVITHIGPTVDRHRARQEAEAAYGKPVGVAVVSSTYRI